MGIKEIIKKTVTAGAGLLSLIQASAGDFEVIPEKGTFTPLEKKRAEEMVKYTFKVGSVIIGPGYVEPRTGNISIFGRYGLSAKHCFIYAPKFVDFSRPRKELLAEAAKTNLRWIMMQKSETFAVIAGKNNTNDWVIIKTDKKIRNERQLYRGTERLIQEGRKVSWAGLWGVKGDGVNTIMHIYGPLERKNPTLTYYSSIIASNKPLSGKDFVCTNGMTGEQFYSGPRWVTDADPVNGTSGSVVYAEAKGRGRTLDIPIGVLNSGLYWNDKRRAAFVHIDEFIDEIEKYERKTGEKNVKIIPLPDWIK